MKYARTLIATLALVVCTSAYAVDITLTFANATEDEQRAAAWKLDKVNTVLADHGEPTHATITDYLKSLIVQQLQAWKTQQAEDAKILANVRARWLAATDAERTAALAQLPAVP